MRMQISRFFELADDGVASESPLYELTGVLSEWLFSVKFWREFNISNGTMFDQFEEDEVHPDMIRKVAHAVQKKHDEVASDENQLIEFVYRRALDGTATTAKISNVQLAEEIAALQNFLTSEADKQTHLVFSL